VSSKDQEGTGGSGLAGKRQQANNFSLGSGPNGDRQCLSKGEEASQVTRRKQGGQRLR